MVFFFGYIGCFGEMGFLYFSNGSLSTCLNLWFFGILGALGKWVYFVFLVALSACIVFFFHSYMSKGMVFLLYWVLLRDGVSLFWSVSDANVQSVC